MRELAILDESNFHIPVYRQIITIENDRKHDLIMTIDMRGRKCKTIQIAYVYQNIYTLCNQKVI